MEETLALQLPSSLSTRLRRLAHAAAIPVDHFVVQTLEATLAGNPSTKLPFAPSLATETRVNHQESVLMVLHRMSETAQARMEWLMARNTEGTLTKIEAAELTALVAEYEQILLANSEQLLRMQQPINH